MFPQYDHADPRGEEMVNQTVQRLKQLDEERPQVILVTEPENMKDPNAVRVYCEGSPIGYVAHEQTGGAQLLFDASTPIVPARIVRVEVERKGNFYIEADVPESARRKQLLAKDEAVDAWKDWRCGIPKLPITDGWKSCQVLELLIESQFPVRTLEQVKNLKTYCNSRANKKKRYFMAIRWILDDAETEPAKPIENGVEIAPGSWNIRSGPATSYESVGTAKGGETYERLAGMNGWIPIIYNGDVRWIGPSAVKQ